MLLYIGCSLLCEAASKDPLLAAVKKGKVADAEAALAKGSDVNQRSPDGSTSLMYAADSRNVEMVRLLLSKGADANARVSSGQHDVSEGFQSPSGSSSKKSTGFIDPNNEDRTALMFACNDYGVAGSGYVEANVVEIVKMLLDRGADVNASRTKGHCKGETALAEAARTRQLEVVRILLDKGADVNARWDAEDFGGGYFRTVLMTACGQPAIKKQTIDIVILLVNHGADINIKNNHDDSALSEAAYSSDTRVVKFLLSKGADIKTCGAKSLWIAGRLGSPEVVDLLLDSGIDINVKGVDGGSALIAAVEACGWAQTIKPRYIERVKYFLSKEPDVNIKDNSGKTALSEATKRGLKDVVALLEAAGAK